MSLSERIGGHIRANVVGYLALFVALAGTSYAATKITSNQIAKNAITSKLIKDGQVASADVADNGLTGTDINEATLNGIQGPAGAVGPQGPAGPSGQSTGAAGGDLSGNYPNPQIAPGSITNAEIAPAAAIEDAKLGTINDPGKVADAALSANVATLNQSQAFTAGKLFSGAIPTAVNASDSAIGTALNIGDNDIKTSGATISSAELEKLDGSPTRSVNIPISSFFNVTDNATLDFTASDGTSPDFGAVSARPYIEWDDDTDGGGANIADTDRVASQFVVPRDYASGGTFRMLFRTTGTVGVSEVLICDASKNDTAFGATDSASGGGFSAFFATNITPAADYIPGDVFVIRCHWDDGSGGTTANDTLRLHGMAFDYAAAH